MTDPVYDAITDAIAGPIDGNLFERCAVELLRDNYYPTLRPVQGGSDAGMDGVGELADGERFFLVATTGTDAQGNLDRNIRSHLNAGGDRRVVVLATTHPVSGRRRASLAQHLWEQFEVRLHDVHDRADFIQLLYRSPQWRRDLLGVPAQARALTRLPANRRPMPSIPLIGRGEDLASLRSATGDLVLIGKPGIGKTSLLQELMKDEWGLFDDNWPIPQLEDAIRELRPPRVVLDDAHLRDDRLSVLRRLRLEMGADFDIVAVAWPGQVHGVAEALPEASMYELLELDRAQILQVIQEVGVAGPRELQAHLVNQAMGRAGLAATLAYACVRGRVHDVATGEALLTDVLGWFARSIGRESRHVLAVLALSGSRGATMRQVGEILGLDLPRVSDLIGGLASGGTVDEAPRHEGAARLRVQPESLRYALVKEGFFGGAGSLDVAEAIGHLDRPSSALLPLIGAAHRGASVDRGLLLQLMDPADSEQVTAYALLGPQEATAALAASPEHRTSIARAAYQSGVSPKQMLQILMESAVGDGRNENSSPDHPLRVIGDHLAASDRTIEERMVAVSVADEWLRAGGDAAVAFRVLAHAIHPGVRLIYSDPGLGNTVTIAEAALPAQLVRELSPVWDSVLELVERHREASPVAIIEALHYWVYPSSLRFGRSADDELDALIRSEASRVIQRLAAILRGRSGALRRLRDYVTRGRLDVQIDVPEDFNVLFPEDWNGSEDDGGHGGWARRADDAVRSLASAMRRQRIDEIASRIVSADAEASAAGINYPRFTPRLAQLLADEPSLAAPLLDRLNELEAAGDVLLPFLERVVEEMPEGWERILQRMLGDQRTVWIAVQVSLTHAVGPEFKDAAVRRMTAAYRNLISFLIARGEVDQETVERLLDAPDRVVARDVAVSIWQASRGIRLDDLSATARARWRETIVGSPADDYWYSVILKSDPDLFADWLRGWFSRVGEVSDHEFLPHTLEESIRSLPADVRADLIAAVPADVHSFFVQDVVTELVADDTGVALVLLGRDDLEDLHWTALRGGPSEAWMERALAALERGWEPMRIVAQTTFAEKVWSGEESMHWQSKIDAFTALRQGRAASGDRERLIAAGIQFFTERRDAAVERERRERVFGIDRQ